MQTFLLAPGVAMAMAMAMALHELPAQAQANKEPLVVQKRAPFVITTHRALVDVLVPPLTKRLGETEAACKALNLPVPTDFHVAMVDAAAAAADPRLKPFAAGQGAATHVGGPLAFTLVPDREALLEAMQEAIKERTLGYVRMVIALSGAKDSVPLGPTSFLTNLIHSQEDVISAKEGSQPRKTPTRIVDAGRHLKKVIDNGRPLRDIYVELLGVMTYTDMYAKADAEALSLLAPYALLEPLQKPKIRQELAAAMLKMIRGTAGTTKSDGEAVAKMFTRAMLEADGKKLDKKDDPVDLMCRRLMASIETIAAEK